jgi:hypothetical protein
MEQSQVAVGEDDPLSTVITTLGDDLRINGEIGRKLGIQRAGERVSEEFYQADSEAGLFVQPAKLHRYFTEVPHPYRDTYSIV